MKTFLNLKNQNKECYNPSKEAKRDCNIRRSGFENIVYFFFVQENMKQQPSKVAHDWPKFANLPKTSPNLIFCSIKMSPYFDVNTP